MSGAGLSFLGTRALVHPRSRHLAQPLRPDSLARSLAEVVILALASAPNPNGVDNSVVKKCPQGFNATRLRRRRVGEHGVPLSPRPAGRRGECGLQLGCVITPWRGRAAGPLRDPRRPSLLCRPERPCAGWWVGNVASEPWGASAGRPRRPPGLGQKVHRATGGEPGGQTRSES